MQAFIARAMIAKRYMADIRPDQMMKVGVALLCAAVACSQQPTFGLQPANLAADKSYGTGSS